MAGKSRQKRKKYAAQNKKRAANLSKPTTPAQPATTTQTNETLPSPAVPASSPKPVAVRHPHIAAELRTIGILAVIMLIVLIVLASVPRPW